MQNLVPPLRPDGTFRCGIMRNLLFDKDCGSSFVVSLHRGRRNSFLDFINIPASPLFNS